ncbi:hypothetical protein ETB97_012656 [Aspergillus alliaceus]|uniref:Uncharacterized protein n=1 Tax=Petromyces alliaceus TaxID=209559 RepID=A0A5N6FSU2_PETAA|nr:uncharacterized protein BDW43DRAFT_311993 [Aspergillus alliaceus]KAB8232607.1 hypothetical protein BDW43DRAFT_311993 [Aspergillus alliaceus]KAF5861705.1 hypothetical protein ETB97_012656 [Aspergillus burnettii]
MKSWKEAERQNDLNHRCASGLGLETARALCGTQATLYLIGRDVEELRTLGDILQLGLVHILELDLSSLESAHACLAELLIKSAFVPQHSYWERRSHDPLKAAQQISLKSSLAPITLVVYFYSISSGRPY